MTKGIVKPTPVTPGKTRATKATPPRRQGSRQLSESADRPVTHRIDLREDVRSRGPLKVDRDKGVIYGVKVLGLESVNNRRYLPQAARNARSLYENAHVNIDHPPKKEGPNASRSSYDRFGKLINVRFVENDGLYADLEYLKAHPMADRICEAAERMPDLFGMSHNAQGEGKTVDGVFVIEQITEVRHVDLVADPATTQSLFESKEAKPMKIKIQKLLESRVLPKLHNAKVKAALRKLVEDDAYSDMEMDDAGDQGDYCDHLFNAFKAAKDSDPEMANKILGMMKQEIGAEEEEEKVEGPPQDSAQEEEDDEPTEEEEDPGKKKDTEEEECPTAKKNAKESKQAKKNKGPAKDVLENRCRRLCKLAGVDPAKDLVEELHALPQSVQMTVLDRIKASGAKSNRQTPRSQSPGNGSLPVQESDQRDAPKISTDPDEQAVWLMN